MAQIFITGAAGFIGFHLALALAKRGDRVLGFDNFNSYYSPKLKRERSLLLQQAGIQVIEGDICDLATLTKCIKDHSPSHIVHLAAQAGVRYSITHPQTYVQTNIQGFLNVLECCRHNPHTKLIYASSSSVYGLNTKVPFAPEDRTDQQASLYGVTKKANELMAHTYHSLYGIPVTGLRFFTVYGPWGRPDMAYYSFTKAILSGDVIEIYNQGQLKRDFTYIDDIVKGTIAAVDLGAGHEIFNLGNHQPIALLDFVEILERTLGMKANKKFMPMQAGDVLMTYADIEHSKNKLGYIPQTTLEQGLRHFVDWYKESKGSYL